MFDVFDNNGNLDLSKLANYSEFLGLFITLGTLAYSFFIERKIRKIERRILFDNNLAGTLKDLIKANSEISNCLSKYKESVKALRKEILICETVLRNIRKQVHQEERKAATKILAKIHRVKIYRLDIEPKQDEPFFLSWFRPTPCITENDLWDIYSSSNALVRQLEYSIKNNKKISRYVS